MHYEPRDTGADAEFIDSGGLKNWGCFALLLAVLACILLLVHALLLAIIRDPVAWWGSVLFLAGCLSVTIVFWQKRRQKQRAMQELLWQQMMGNSSHEKKS